MVIQAAVRSVTTQGSVESDNQIEKLEIIDRDTSQTLETLTVNKASSASLSTFDYAIDVTAYFTAAGQRRFRIVATDDAGNTGSKNVNVTAVDVTIESVQTLRQNVVLTFDGGATVAHSITAALDDAEKTTVAIVLEPTSQAPYSGIGVAKMYFDGEEIGACYYDAGSLVAHATEITFDGTDGDLYLYNVKAWKTYFGFEQEFGNYLLTMTDTDAMIEEYEFNNVMASQTAENTTKNRPQAASLYALGLPYFVLCKNADTADNDAKDNYPEYLETLDGDKKTKRILDVYAYFPDRPWQDFKAVGVTVSNQGTTSSKRPIKNIKMKFKGSTITLLHTADEFTGDALEKFGECLANAAKQRVQVADDSLPTNIITVKVDYSESGGANNGASTNLFNDLQRGLGDDYVTPAQKAYNGTTGYIINTSIRSIPCAFFRTDRYSADATSPSYGYFHAKGNWNEDKGDAKVFGFEGVSGYNADCLNYGDFIELVAAQGQTLSDFAAAVDKSAWQSVDDEGNENVYVLSEFCGAEHKVYRYKDGAWTETTGTMTYTGGKWVVTGDVVNPVENYELLKYDALCWFQGVASEADMLTLDTDGKPVWLQYFESRYPDDDNLNALYEAGKKLPYQLYRWLRFCNDCDYAQTTGSITLGGETVDGTTSNRLQKWQQELHTVANVHSVLAYHVFTDYLAAVDQRAKNMMVGFYLDTDGVVRMYLNHLYDGDTILGSDNDCGLTIPALVDPNDDDAGVYQGHGSVLFTQIANMGTDAFWLDDTGSSTVTTRDVAQAMRSYTDSGGLRPFSYDGIVDYWITRRLQLWPKVVSSFDGERKYIGASKATANYFYALHGLSIKRLKDFVKTRFLYRDGFYQTGDLFSSMVSMRCTGEDVTVKITAAKEGYFGIGVDRANTATDSCYLKAGESYTLKSGMTNTGSGTMLYIFGADKLASLDISDATPSQQSWDISALVLIKELIIGGSDYTAANNAQGYLTTLTLGNLPFLESLDIRNTAVTTVDAQYCPRLRTVLATGSKLTRIDLAEQSGVETLALPDTYKYLKLRYLPSLTNTGLTLADAGSVETLIVEGCTAIDAWALLMQIADADGTALKYVRVTGVQENGDGADLATLAALGLLGVDATLTAGGAVALTGEYTLTKYADEDTLADWQATFSGLTIYQAQYTLICFDDAIEEGYDGNITNLDNGSTDGDSGGYAPSGHITQLQSRLHVYKGTYNESTEKMQLEQLSDTDMHLLANGDECDLTDTNGAGFDFFLGLPHYWYKGINDHVNQKKYIAFSTETAEPRSTATTVRRCTLSDILLKALTGIYVENYAAGDAFNADALTASSANNTYRMDVSGMKQVRWPGINSNTVGGLFLDADGNVLSTVYTYITAALSDFIQGDYVFASVPDGAATFIFTTPVGYDTLECIAVDSAEVEAIEPDWVEHDFELIGVYMAGVDNLMRLRSVSGATIAYGNGTSTTSSYWSYDANGDLTVGLPQSGTSMNYTCKDFLNLARCRGTGYRLVDYEQHKDVANLWMAIHGRRNSQAVCGSGAWIVTTGGTDSTTEPSPFRETTSGRPRTLGLEDWWGNRWEVMDGVAINVTSYAAYYKNKSVAPSGSTVDHVWHILMRDGTERTVQGVSGFGLEIVRVRHGRYCDVIPSKLTTNTSYNTYYCDQQDYTATTGRCVWRSGYNAYAYYGLVSVGASYDASDSSGVVGARLAFRGECEFVE